MSTIGERIKEERIRLGLNQNDLADICGVNRGSQVRYEAGDRMPDGNYFAALDAIGGDIRYILAGKSKADRVEEPLVGYRSVINTDRLLAATRLVEHGILMSNGNISDDVKCRLVAAAYDLIEEDSEILKKTLLRLLKEIVK